MKVTTKSCSDNIAVIPARKNSKRLKNKNLLSIGRKNLISRTAGIAEESSLFSRIIISTDIPRELMDIHFSSSIIYNQRPHSLCTADASTDSLIDYLIDRYKMADSNVITLLQPTSPMRDINDLQSALNLYAEGGKSVVSGLKLSDLYRIEKDIIAEGAHDMIMINGAIYIFSVKEFRKRQCIPIEGCTIFYMNYIKSIDIDCEYQYNAARILIENKYLHSGK